jgi:hypothetical protein
MLALIIVACWCYFAESIEINEADESDPTECGPNRLFRLWHCWMTLGERGQLVDVSESEEALASESFLSTTRVLDFD